MGRRFHVGDWVVGPECVHRILGFSGDVAYDVDCSDAPITDGDLQPTGSVSFAAIFPSRRPEEEMKRNRSNALLTLRAWLDERVGRYEVIDENGIAITEDEVMDCDQKPGVVFWIRATLRYRFPVHGAIAV